MKTLKIFFTLSLIALLTSCGASKQSTTTTTTNSTTNRTVNTKTTSVPDNTSITPNAKMNNSESRTTTATRTDANEVNQRNMQQMFTALNMDDSQVIRFKRESKSYMSTWKRSNPNQEMNAYEKIEYRDKLMKSILNETQFKDYQQWALKNASKN